MDGVVAAAPRGTTEDATGVVLPGTLVGGGGVAFIGADVFEGATVGTTAFVADEFGTEAGVAALATAAVLEPDVG